MNSKVYTQLEWIQEINKEVREMLKNTIGQTFKCIDEFPYVQANEIVITRTGAGDLCSKELEDALNKALGYQPSEYIEVKWTVEENDIYRPPTKPKCDCGGEKCKLPCVDWCSTRRKHE